MSVAGRKAGELKNDGTPAKAPGGKPLVATPEQVEQIKSLAGRGVGEKHIALLIGVDRDTLRSNPDMKRALAEGRAVGIATITGVLFGEARKGSFKHAALYLNRVAGWSAKKKVEHTGAGGGPIGMTILTAVPEADPEPGRDSDDEE